MLENTYIAIFFTAMYFTKMGIVDRKAELFAFPFATLLYAIFAFNSLNVEAVSNGSIISIQHTGAFLAGVIFTILMILFTILSALGKLPEPKLKK